MNTLAELRKAYLSLFDSPALALFDIAEHAGIAVAYIDRNDVEDYLGRVLTEEEWAQVRPNLDGLNEALYEPGEWIASVLEESGIEREADDDFGEED